jgi:hypothetical protein
MWEQVCEAVQDEDTDAKAPRKCTNVLLRGAEVRSRDGVGSASSAKRAVRKLVRLGAEQLAAWMP